MISTTSTTNPYFEMSLLGGRIGKSIAQYAADAAKVEEIKKTIPAYHESMIAELESKFWNIKNKPLGETLSIKGQLNWHKEQLASINECNY